MLLLAGGYREVLPRCHAVVKADRCHALFEWTREHLLCWSKLLLRGHQMFWDSSQRLVKVWLSCGMIHVWGGNVEKQVSWGVYKAAFQDQRIKVHSAYIRQIAFMFVSKQTDSPANYAGIVRQTRTMLRVYNTWTWVWGIFMTDCTGWNARWWKNPEHSVKCSCPHKLIWRGGAFCSNGRDVLMRERERRDDTGFDWLFCSGVCVYMHLCSCKILAPGLLNLVSFCSLFGSSFELYAFALWRRRGLNGAQVRWGVTFDLVAGETEGVARRLMDKSKILWVKSSMIGLLCWSLIFTLIVVRITHHVPALIAEHLVFRRGGGLEGGMPHIAIMGWDELGLRAHEGNWRFYPRIKELRAPVSQLMERGENSGQAL